MVEYNNAFSPPSGMTTWRAGCGESRTSGSEGGPGKPTSREADRAPRSDPYTEHWTREGKLCQRRPKTDPLLPGGFQTTSQHPC